jgi:hypothetical protein
MSLPPTGENNYAVFVPYFWFANRKITVCNRRYAGVFHDQANVAADALAVNLWFDHTYGSDARVRWQAKRLH